MPSIFSDEWRACLRAHYTHVVRVEDKGTERTLRGVMIHEAGFTDAELKELYVRATVHVDDVGADFVPDTQIFADEAPVMVAMPQAVIEAMVVEEALDRDEISDAADTLTEDTSDAEAAEDVVADQDEPPPADPDVTQLSLF